jgi:[acyl-carrier-protein] S-malonyltransferase
MTWTALSSEAVAPGSRPRAKRRPHAGRGTPSASRSPFRPHTPFLAAATEQFRTVLREASLRLPRAGYRLLSGIDGDTIHDIEAGIDKLARQISAPIDWAACLESCRSAGASAALELGPGIALSRMASTLFPDGRARAVEEFRTLAGLQTWLEQAIG